MIDITVIRFPRIILVAVAVVVVVVSGEFRADFQKSKFMFLLFCKTGTVEYVQFSLLLIVLFVAKV